MIFSMIVSLVDLSHPKYWQDDSRNPTVSLSFKESLGFVSQSWIHTEAASNLPPYPENPNVLFLKHL